jgi:hypothetical protein
VVTGKFSYPFQSSEQELSMTDVYRSQTYWALMTKNSHTLMSEIVSIFMEESNNVKTVANITPSCVFQPITTDMISHFSKNGGNALGITAADGSLVRMCLQLPIMLKVLALNVPSSAEHRVFLVFCRR